MTSMAKTADYMAKYAQSDSKKGIGYIHEFHSGYNSTYRLDEEKTLRNVATSYDSFVTLSEGDAKLFAQWLNCPVEAVHNPVEPLSEEISEMLRLGEKKPVIQYIGRYGLRRGWVVSLKASLHVLRTFLSGRCAITEAAQKKRF